MSFTATINTLPTRHTGIKLDNALITTESTDFEDTDDLRLIEDIARTLSFGDDEAVRCVNEASRASFEFFQSETRRWRSHFNQPSSRRQRNSFLGLDGKVQDDYIAKRVELNKPADKRLGDRIPTFANLSKAESITEIDGNVLAQLFLSGYAKLGSKVDYLNKINVFPIADGDTGVNMKVCLKLPCRNLILDPSPSILRVASNMAADVLLNGQGNSGTILSHFYVSLAEEIRDIEDPACHETLSIDAFAACLVRVGGKMASSVPNPVEGTLLSVARDSCEGLAQRKYSNLKELLDTWKNIAEAELKATPGKLIVDGVKVLEKAGVVDSGAQGFFYTIEGMWLASNDELPEASDPNLFKSGVKKDDGQEHFPDIIDNHDVCDSKYQFCTEAVILLKDGVAKEEVLNAIDLQCYEITEPAEQSSCACPCGHKHSLGDSVASVSAPAKEGGNMLKVHIHTDEPQRFFDTLKPYSRDAIFKKEKVEDMKIMREVEHGNSCNNTIVTNDSEYSVDNAKFTLIGLTSLMLPPTVKAEYKDILNTFPMFIVPADTNEPIDIRHASDTDTVIALNKQRNPDTKVRITTATSTPMQMKIELLASLSKGKPVLCVLFSTSKKLSAYGRNVLQAIELLDPDQRDKVKVFVHGWAHDGIFLLEALDCAKRGKTIDEAIAACEDVAKRTFNRVGFMDAETFRNIKTWRPGLFPESLDVPEGHYCLQGPPSGVRQNEIPLDKRVDLALGPFGMGISMEDTFEKTAKHIKSGLEPSQKIGNVMIPCVGRPDNGHFLVRKLREEGIEIVGNPYVYTEGMIGVVMGSWGGVTIMYKIIEE